MPSRSAAAKLVGLPNSGTGVGSNLLMSKQALEDLGLNPKVVDIGGGSECVSRDLQGWKRRRELARPMVLHHLNADKIPQAMASFGTCNRGNQVNIGFLLWEFSVLPLEHRLALDMLDEIWVPSEFVRNTYSDAGARNVANVGKAIALPNVPKADLRRFGIPPGTTTFLTCFDFHSSVERKNPLAAVEGFLAAFSGRADVRLVVKTTPPTKNHWGDAAGQWSKIEALAARDPRLILMTERVPFADLIALIKGVDCLISPHRSEGFGLLPAYALASATPVIATDYSGTRDFCTDKTSLPVPYRLVPVGAKDALFQMKGAMWADIDRHALARVMRDFADDPMDGRMRAVRGRHLIGTKYAPKAHAARYRERLESLGVLSPETACERLA